MSTKMKWVGAGSTALLVAATFGVVQVIAQVNPANPGSQPGAKPGIHTGDTMNQQEGRSVTLTGKLVDLHCYMTGKMGDKNAMGRSGANTRDNMGAGDKNTGDKSQSADAMGKEGSKCAKCIRNGVPCAIDSDQGLVILGKEDKGAGDELAQYASRQITVRGQLFERNGLKYLEIQDVQSQEAGRQNPHSGATGR